jgi:hypothetical protein
VYEHGDDTGSSGVNPLLDIIPHVTFTLPYYGSLAAGAIIVRHISSPPDFCNS